MVTTAATYARGDSRYRSEHMSYFGISTTFGTFMKNTKLWREQMDEAIATRLQTLNNIVCCIDNNQKGNTLKNQRYGKSVKYIKVTGCLICKYNHCNYIDYETYKNSKTNLTYSNQAIPSTFLMPHFDVIFSNEDYPSDRDLV